MESNINYGILILGFAVVSAGYTAIDYMVNRMKKPKEKIDIDNSNVMVMCMTENDFREFRRGNVWITALDDV